MAPLSGTLAWKIPWTKEPGGLQSLRSLSRTRLHFHFSFSCIGKGNGNPLQCSCLENPRDGGAWWAAVCRVAQGRTRLKRQQQQCKEKVQSHGMTVPVICEISTRWQSLLIESKVLLSVNPVGLKCESINFLVL